MGELVHSGEYQSFRASIPLKKVCVENASASEWAMYDIGSRTIHCPLVCLPPVSGHADIYFKQMLALSSAGYRIISVDYPIVWNCTDFCDSFNKLLDFLNIKKVHLLGASLGGFLAQKYAEHTLGTQRVQSLILCNAFINTEVFEQTMAAPTYWMLPALALKTMVMGNFERTSQDGELADAVDFVVDALDSLSRRELASRLTLNCRSAKVDVQRLSNIPITIIDVNDNCALTMTVKDSLYKAYPHARRAHLKSGGNFPYLSRADEFNLHLQIHLRQFTGMRSDEAADVECEETCVDQINKTETATTL